MVRMQEKPRVQAVAAAEKPYAPIVLRLPPQWELTEQCLMEIASLNDPWRFERNAEGALEIVPPPGPLSSKRGVQILIQIAAWILNGGLGDLFESSAGFRLGDSSIRAADVSWVSDERLTGVEMDHEGAWPVCPDFVVEICSPSDRLPQQQAKMRQWMTNGARLGLAGSTPSATPSGSTASARPSPSRSSAPTSSTAAISSPTSPSTSPKSGASPTPRACTHMP